MQYTSRRPDFLPYCTLKPIHDFIEQNKEQVTLDWGCGENNHKLVYGCDKWIGIDRTLEADIYGFPRDVWNTIPQSTAILAINSVHFSPNVYDEVERIITDKLVDGGAMFFTINDTGHAKAALYSDIDKWKKLGTVDYFWYIDDHREQLENDLADHLYDDPTADMKLGATDMSDMYHHVHNLTIKQDPFHGLLRVKITK